MFQTPQTSADQGHNFNLIIMYVCYDAILCLQRRRQNDIRTAQDRCTYQIVLRRYV